MISQQLRDAWRDRARDLCIHRLGEAVTPKRAPFSLYIRRLFSRSALAHINDSNIIDNIGAVETALAPDVANGRGSDLNIATYLKHTLRDAIQESRFP